MIFPRYQKKNIYILLPNIRISISILQYIFNIFVIYCIISILDCNLGETTKPQNRTRFLVQSLLLFSLCLYPTLFPSLYFLRFNFNPFSFLIIHNSSSIIAYRRKIQFFSYNLYEFWSLGGGGGGTQLILMGCCSSKSVDSKASRVNRWRSTGIVALRDSKLKVLFSFPYYCDCFSFFLQNLLKNRLLVLRMI